MSLDIVINLLAYDMTRNAFNSLSDNMKGVGLAGGLLFKGFETVASDAVNAASDLEYSLTRLQLATESNSQAFPILKDAVVDLGIHSLYSSSEAAQAFERLSEMGFSVQQVLYGMAPAASSLMDGFYHADQAAQGLGRSAMAVGEAMSTDAVSGADLLGAALNVFKDQGFEASDMANKLIGAFYNGIPSASELGDAIEMAGGMADAAGIQFQDFVTTLALLRQAGMSGSEAGASLRYMIQSLTAPTDKQAKALADLGIRVVETDGYFQTFSDQLSRSGATGELVASQFDGSVQSLKNMFVAAQNAGMISLDKSFNQWAEANNLLNTSLFDTQGNFSGLKNAVDVLDSAMADKHLSVEQKLDAITQLFNVRSGRAATILTNLDDFDKQYTTIWDRIDQVNGLKNAQTVMSTFKGSLDTFKDSFLSQLAAIAMPWIDFGSKVLKGANDMLDGFNTLGPGAQIFFSIFIPAGMILSAAAVGVALFSAALTFAAPILGAFAITVGIVIGGAILLAAGVALLVTHWGMLTDALNRVIGPGTAINTLFNVIFNIVSMLWNMLGNMLGPELSQIGQSFGRLWDAAAPVRELLQDLSGVLGGALLIALGLVGAAILITITLFLTMLAVSIQIVAGIITVFANLAGTIKDLCDGLGAAFQLAMAGKFQEAADVMGKTGQKLQGDLGKTWDDIKDDAVGIWDTMKAPVDAAQKAYNSMIISNNGDLTHALEGQDQAHVAKTLQIQKSAAQQNLDAVNAQIAQLIQAKRDASSKEEADEIQHQINILQAQKAGYQAQVGAEKQANTDKLNAQQQAHTAAVNDAHQQADDMTAAMQRQHQAVTAQANGQRDDVTTAAQQQKDNVLRIIADQAAGIEHGSQQGAQKAKDAATDMKTGVAGALSALGGNSYGWGADAGNNFAAGIASATNAARTAALGVAGAVAAALHHSKPDEGPMVDDDTWGGDFVGNIIAGMLGRQGDLHSAALTLANSMSLPFNTPQLSASAVNNSRFVANSPNSSFSGTTTIPIYIGGRKFTELVLDQTAKVLKVNSAGKALNK